ncbi:MAG: AraC family transcriptional regulator [Gammaproteobacteria bacterium]
MSHTLPSQTPNTAPELPASSDPLGEVLRLLQMSGVLYCNAELTDPWGIEVPALPGVMNVEVITSGSCWVEVEGQSPVHMPEGSLMLIPRGRRHWLRGNPGDRTTGLGDIPVEKIGERFENMRFGGGGRLTRATYYGVRYDPILAARLIDLLPEVLVMRTHPDEDEWLHGTIRFIAREAREGQPGGETVITRLADILVIQAIRRWMEEAREHPTGWIAALHDRWIGKAMMLMHRQPERDWRVETLAQAVGMSRSGFSARFSALMGEPVLRYLTGLRMQLAHRDLRETRDSLIRIAERVGYHSEPAFNRAFKREMGVPPGAVRRLG